jgi:hypothetical protein
LYLCFVTLMFASVAGLAVLSLKLATLIGSIPLLLLFGVRVASRQEIVAGTE